MIEDLEFLWSKLFLTEDEQNVVKINEDWIEKIFQEDKNCLVEKIFIKKIVNIEAMKNVFIIIVFHSI